MVRKVTGGYPQNSDGLRLAVKAAIDVEEWDSAVIYLDRLEAVEPSVDCYKFHEMVEQQTKSYSERKMSGSRKIPDNIVEKMPEKSWVCSQTGRVYERWTAIAQPHGAFNTIIWDYPYARRVNDDMNNNSLLSYQSGMFLIDPVS